MEGRETFYENLLNFYLRSDNERTDSISTLFSAQWLSDGEVQLPDSDPGRTSRGGDRWHGLGPADRSSAMQNQTRPLPDVQPWWTAATHGGDSSKTQQVTLPASFTSAHTQSISAAAAAVLVYSFLNWGLKLRFGMKIVWKKYIWKLLAAMRGQKKGRVLYYFFVIRRRV